MNSSKQDIPEMDDLVLIDELSEIPELIELSERLDEPAIKELQNTSAVDLLLINAVENQNLQLLQLVVNNGYSNKVVKRLLKYSAFDSVSYLYLMALKYNHMLCKQTIIHVDGMAFVMGFKLHVNYFLEEASSDNINLDDQYEFRIYCMNILKMLWPIKQSVELQYITLKIANYYANQLLPDTIQNDKNNVDSTYVLCAIHEQIYNCLLLIKEFYAMEGFVKLLLFPSNLVWIFHSLFNPMDKSILEHMKLHNIGIKIIDNGSKISPHADISHALYVTLFKQTYNINRIITDIKTVYKYDSMLDTIAMLNNGSTGPAITRDKLIPLMVYDFIITHELSDYLIA